MRQSRTGLIRAPTDLSNFAGCRHLAGLDLRAARRELERPTRNDAFVEDLRARGLAHERAYLERLRAQGLTIAGADVAGELGVAVFPNYLIVSPNGEVLQSEASSARLRQSGVPASVARGTLSRV